MSDDSSTLQAAPTRAAPPLDIVIMAAGKGTRMRSRLPKVLHKLAGRPLLSHVLATAEKLNARSLNLIVGHGADLVEVVMRTAHQNLPLQFVLQQPQLGTGHAVQQAVPVLQDDGITLILNGDVPLIAADTLAALLQASDARQLALLTVNLPDPSGYGRIVRDGNGAVQAIVEHKDASAVQRDIHEVYTGVMAVPNAALKTWLARLSNDNAQGEYYLTDIVKFAVADGAPVTASLVADRVQVEGVNSPLQLAQLERAYQARAAEALMVQGVRLADPARFDLRGELACGEDVEIDVNCIFEGKVSLGAGVRVGANCVIANAQIADGAVIHPFTHIDGEQLGVTVG